MSEREFQIGDKVKTSDDLVGVICWIGAGVVGIDIGRHGVWSRGVGDVEIIVETKSEVEELREELARLRERIDQIPTCTCPCRSNP